jgi:hypothetical protein
LERTFITNFMSQNLIIIIVQFFFHKFIWNIHKCHSSIYIVWTLMSCALFKHECHMPIRIFKTWMLYVYLCCLHTKVVHMTFVLNNARHSWFNNMSLWSNKFGMNLEWTHEAYKFVMLAQFVSIHSKKIKVLNAIPKQINKSNFANIQKTLHICAYT